LPRQLRRRASRLTALLPAALLAAGTLTIAPTAAHADVPTADRPALASTHNVLPGLSRAADLGAAPASTPMRLVVAVKRPDAAAEKAFVAAVHDPASPDYRHFLTPAQFQARFGVTEAQRQSVASFLTGGGLSLDKVSAAGDVYSVRGSASQVGALFGTAIHRYSYGGQKFLANTAAPTFPSRLGITNVIGLNTLQQFSLPAKVAKAAKAGTQQGSCLPAGITCTDSCLPVLGCTGGTTPQDLWSVYERPDSATGKGQGVAVFGEGATDGVVSDLRAFETKFGLPQVPVTVKHPAGDTDFSDDSGRAEWNIDTQASTGMAPDVDNLTLYFGADLSDADVTSVFSQFTDDTDGPKQASASYGECETIPYLSSALANVPLIGLGNNMDPTLDQITRQAAAEGKSIFVSTGDTGSSCPVVALPVIGAGNGLVNQGLPVTNSPASLPYVTAVGGTVLYTDGKGKRTREYGWAYSGGGSTLFTPAPDYQRGVSGINIPCVTDPSVTCRGIADVAAQSGDVLGNGYDIVMNGSYTEGGGGGTSLSAPLMQGLWADVQTDAPAGGLGFANYGLYSAGKSAEDASFFDVNSLDPTTGLPASNGLYVTTPGWDYVTGWGTPKVGGLICVLDQTGC